MAETFGAIALPVVAPAVGVPVSDPLVYHLASFLQSVVNAKATAAWNAVCPGSAPIRFVHYHEPDELCFVKRELPALFVWREEASRSSEWIAEDYLQSHETIRIVWGFPDAVQNIMRVRHPIVNALAKVMTAAIELGRDPAWVVAGDPDPDAAAWGSVLYRWCNLDAIQVSKWARKLIRVPLGDGSERAEFESLEATVSIDELLVEDLSKYPLATGVNQTIQQPAGLVTDTAEYR